MTRTRIVLTLILVAAVAMLVAWPPARSLRDGWPRQRRIPDPKQPNRTGPPGW